MFYYDLQLLKHIEKFRLCCLKRLFTALIPANLTFYKYLGTKLISCEHIIVKNLII